MDAHGWVPLADSERAEQAFRLVLWTQTQLLQEAKYVDFWNFRLQLFTPDELEFFQQEDKKVLTGEPISLD